MPAYQAAKTLLRTLADVPSDWVDDYILVDDASSDGTAELARSLGLHVVVHERNTGYGGNQKTCYRTALQRGADIVVMVHPDHQYSPTSIPELLRLIVEKKTDAAFGSRMLTPGAALAGGMPRWKYLANIALTKLANVVLGLRLSEYHSGFRAYHRRVLGAVPFHLNSDDFVFDTEIIVQLRSRNFRIAEAPIPTRYFSDASSIGFVASCRYGLSICGVLWCYLLHRWGLRLDRRFAHRGDQ